LLFGRATPTPAQGPLPVPAPTATQVAVGAPPSPRLYPFSAQLKRSPSSEAPEESVGWLHDVNSPRTRRWISVENDLSARALAAIPQRAAIERRLERLGSAARPQSAREFVTEHVLYLTATGKRLPMLIAHRRDLARDGNQPAILTVLRRHGALTPVIQPRALVWMEMGGVYAAAEVPGAAQFAEAPEGVATLSVRDKALEDLISAAQYLFEERYTRRGRLAIYGRGYGGLLAGALLTEHPDYFAVALPTGTWAEYRHPGSGVCYPPTLIVTATHDGVLRPWRGYELAAAMQRTQVCSDQPVLIRIYAQGLEDDATPAARLASDADTLGFAAKWLGMSVPPTDR
jgi:prolyl oligopeptidase PreP (S9A serine peptidase family)